jgi:hypothetical protein
MSVPEVKATPIWELNAALGLDLDRIAEAKERLEKKHLAGKHEEAAAGCPLCQPDGHVSSERDIFAERVAAAARGEEPPPYEPPPVPSVALSMLGDAVMIPPQE